MSDWKAVYTKSRYEKKVAEALEEKGIEVYCPLQTVVRQWSDRKKKVTVPVFRSYVFVRYTSEMERFQILEHPGVVNFVRYLRKDAIVRENEIEAIRILLGEYGEVIVGDLAEGDAVEITQGVLKGQNGIIKSTDGKKAILILDSLGISLTAEVKNINLHKIKEAEPTEQKKKNKFHF